MPVWVISWKVQKGLKLNLVYIDVNKRKCSRFEPYSYLTLYLSYLSLDLFIKCSFLWHVFAYKTGVRLNVLPFTGNRQVLRDYKLSVCLSLHLSVCYISCPAITYLRIDVLPYSLCHMWSSLSQCAVTLTHTSKVKVTQGFYFSFWSRILYYWYRTVFCGFFIWSFRASWCFLTWKWWFVANVNFYRCGLTWQRLRL